MALQGGLLSSLEGGIRYRFGRQLYYHHHQQHRRCRLASPHRHLHHQDVVRSSSSATTRFCLSLIPSSSPSVLRKNITTRSFSVIIPEFNNTTSHKYQYNCRYQSSSTSRTTKKEKEEASTTKDPETSSSRNDKDDINEDNNNNNNNNKPSYEPPNFSERTTSKEIINIKDRVKIIKDEQQKGIIHVVLSRPQKLNSLDMPMFEAIAEAASRLGGDDDTTKLNYKDMRVVIISGEGRAFCTGLDAKSMAMTGPKSNINKLLERPSKYGGEDGISNLAQDVCYLWRKLPIPVIAVLHGMCFGGGLQIALGADMRYATSDCRLSIMESRWGLIPDMGASIVLPGLVRMDVAKELTMTGRIVSGIEAEKLGLITRYVDDPMYEALKVAKEIMERSPDSVAATKELFQSTWVEPCDETSLKKETEIQMRLIGTWNQIAASSKNFGFNLPYYFNNNKNFNK